MYSMDIDRHTQVQSGILTQPFQQLPLQLLLSVILPVAQLALPTLLSTKPPCLLMVRAAGMLMRQLLMGVLADHTVVTDANPRLVTSHRLWVQLRRLSSGIW